MERIIRDYNIYGRSKVLIPEPQFYVFYNGEENQPERYDMRLSDLFSKRSREPEIEVVCHVININNGMNKSFLEKCSVLYQYMMFVTYVRQLHKLRTDNLQDAIELAIDRCIEEDILADFLRENRWEVVKVVQLDYSHERQISLERRDARAEGKAEGRAEEIFHSVQDGDYSVARGAQKLGITEQEFIQQMEEKGFSYSQYQ